MIEEPTVLVLGAGASQPYGYPLGNELKDRMLRQFRNDGNTRKYYLERGFPDEEIKKFEQAIITSPYDTIDAILTGRPSLNSIGRFAIANILAPCETSDNLFPPKDWYKYFFHRLHLDDPKRPAPPLSIVTFNYDRSLEHYLHVTVDEALEGDCLASAKHKLAQIPIVHVHGQLGEYPRFRYGFYEDPVLVEKASKGIRIVSDVELDKSEEFEKAHDIISKAANILFLGFGYDERNLNRLRIRDLPDGKNICGTAFQFPNTTKVKEYFQDKIKLMGTNEAILSVLKGMATVI